MADLRSVFRSLWRSQNVRFARSVFRDVWYSAMILLSLAAVYWMVKVVGFMGYSAERLEWFEKVHFCSSISAFTLISLTFVVKLAAGLYSKDKFHD